MKRFYFWLRFLISGGLIVFLLYTVNLEELSTSFGRSNYVFILIAFCLGMVDRLIMAYKWNILLRAKGIWISLKELTITYLSATFLGLYLPSTVGADALRAYAVSEDGKGRPSEIVVSSIIVERLLGLIALVTFVLSSIILSIYIFGQSFITNIWNLFWTIFGVLVVISITMIVSLNDKVLVLVESCYDRLNNEARIYQMIKVVVGIYKSYVSYRSNRLQIIIFLILSFLENLFPILWSYLMSLAFKIDVPVLYFFILVPIALALRRLPISIDGTGIHEGAFVYFLSLIGVAKSDALLLGIATHLLAIAIVLPGGFFYAFGGLKLKGKIESLQAPILKQPETQKIDGV